MCLDRNPRLCAQRRSKDWRLSSRFIVTIERREASQITTIATVYCEGRSGPEDPFVFMTPMGRQVWTRG